MANTDRFTDGGYAKFTLTPRAQWYKAGAHAAKTNQPADVPAEVPAAFRQSWMDGYKSTVQQRNAANR